MTIQEAVLQELQQLPPDEQQKVLKYAQSLRPPESRRDPRGMFVYRGVHIAAEDIDAARQEAWAQFPREFPEGTAP